MSSLDFLPYHCWIWAGGIALALCYGVVLTAMVHRRRRFRIGRCRRCGYDLRRLGERRTCPECGKPFFIDRWGRPRS